MVLVLAVTVVASGVAEVAESLWSITQCEYGGQGPFLSLPNIM